MSSPIGSLNNVKIFVLYLMKNVNYPLSYSMINDIVRQNDYVLYLDFDEAFHDMLEKDLIVATDTDESGDKLYEVTKKGALVAEQLKSDLLPSILDKSLTCALRYLDFQKRGITVDCYSSKEPDGSFLVHVEIREKDKILLSTDVRTDSEYRALQMRRNFRERPDVIFRGVVALLTGNVNYLFN